MRTFKPGQTLVAIKRGELSNVINKGDKVTFLRYQNTDKETIVVLLSEFPFAGLSQIEFASIFTAFTATRLKRKPNEHV